MNSLIKKFIFIIIGIILIFLLFFSINYEKHTLNEKEKSIFIDKNIKKIYDYYHIPFENELIQLPEQSDSCSLIFLEDSNPDSFSILDQNQSCFIVIKEKQIYQDFNKTLDFINTLYEFLEFHYKNIRIVSQGFQNLLSLEIAAHYPKIVQLILYDELYPSIPLIWTLIEPRLCYYPQENICVKYKIFKYVHRAEIYERINQPILWIVDKSALIDQQNENLKKSIEIFHQLGKKFNYRKILFKEEIKKN
jgi:hypothetical protein